MKINYQLVETVSNFKVATDGSGDFSHTFTPDKTGDWQVSAHFAVDDACHQASSETLSFTVSSMSTSLTCALSEEEIELGKEVTISGEFSFGMAGLKVELEATSSDNVTELQATTSADGGYRVTFKPDSRGIWRIRARVQGDGFKYEGAERPVAELTVIAPRSTTRIYHLPSILLRPPFPYGVIVGVGRAVGLTVFFIRRRE